MEFKLIIRYYLSLSGNACYRDRDNYLFIYKT